MQEQRAFWSFAAIALAAAIGCLGPVYANDFYRVPGFGVFVSYYRDDALWPAVTHDLPGLAPSIKAADALLLGSSKTLFGIAAGQMNDRFRAQNIRFFNLGIEGGEGSIAADAVIERLDLHGKTLLINLDDNMLSNFASKDMQRAEAMDWFQALTSVYSVRSDAIAETLLDHWGLPQLEIGNSLTLHTRHLPRGLRDPETGDAVEAVARLQPRGEGPYEFTPGPPQRRIPMSSLEEPFFLRIIHDWQARGMRFVFFTIPYGWTDPAENSYTPGLAKEAALKFGGNFIDIDWHGLTSFDHVHVAQQDREKLTDRIVEGLPVLRPATEVATRP